MGAVSRLYLATLTCILHQPLCGRRESCGFHVRPVTGGLRQRVGTKRAGRRQPGWRPLADRREGLAVLADGEWRLPCHMLATSVFSAHHLRACWCSRRGHAVSQVRASSMEIWLDTAMPNVGHRMRSSPSVVGRECASQIAIYAGRTRIPHARTRTVGTSVCIRPEI